jgi:Ca2+-binding RTX toxin-like protein
MSVSEATQFDYFEAARVDLEYLGTLTAGANFRVTEIRLSAFGNTIDLTNGAALDYTVVGGAKADVIRGGAGDEHLYGQAGNDLIHGGWRRG